MSTINTDGFEYRNVFHDNPYLFMSDFEQAIRDGFCVVNNIAGYPRLQGMLKEVRLFRNPIIPQEVAGGLSKYNEVVIDYDPAFFLLKCQAVLLAGYEVDLESPIGGIRFDTPYKCTFRRTEDADVVVAEEELKAVEAAVEDASSEASSSPEAAKPKRPLPQRRRTK